MPDSDESFRSAEYSRAMGLIMLNERGRRLIPSFLAACAMSLAMMLTPAFGGNREAERDAPGAPSAKKRASAASARDWRGSTAMPAKSFEIIRLGFCAGGQSILATAPTSSLLVDAKNGAVIRRYHTLAFDAHRYSVESSALSADGTRFATGSNGAVILWDVATGKKLHDLIGFSQEGVVATRGLAFSPDGSRVVACADDENKRAIVWNSETGKLVATLDASIYRAYPTSVAFSRSGGQVIVGMGDGAILLWRLSTGQVRALLRAHITEVCSLAPSPTESRMLSGSRNDKISVWDLASGTKVRDYKGHEFSAASVAFSPDGKYVAAGRYSGVSIWDAASGKEIAFIKTEPPRDAEGIVGPEGYVTAVAYSEDGKQLAGGFDDGSIMIWSPQTGRRIRTLRLVTTERTQTGGR